jgi:UDP-N-acetylmuramoyl-L-alanyl-D-glutamate--2,6-diaminopimelate ligase
MRGQTLAEFIPRLRLESLLAELDPIRVTGPVSSAIRGVAYHSQAVASAYVFVALPGHIHDGHDFVLEACRRGASAVVVERWLPDLPADVTQIQVHDARVALAVLAGVVYEQPAKQLILIGVTGTNGKTTTSHILEQMLRAVGHNVGVLGTIAYRYGNRTLPAPTTTPESLDLQEILRDMVNDHVTHAIMEVTSHALIQQRVHGCPFRTAVFTNLTRDHLDYHGDMTTYRTAKIRLFEEHLLDRNQGGWAVVNVDDPAAPEILRHCRAEALTFGEAEQADFQLVHQRTEANGTHLTIDYPGGRKDLSSALLGRHNVSNILAACAAAWTLEVGPPYWQAGLDRLPRVRGRFEPVENAHGARVIVDYAHTPDALHRALASARRLAAGKLICVFGCGGNRDQGKRPLMARAAAEFSDLIVVTSDNPRGEPPSIIIHQIVSGFAGMKIRQLDPGSTVDEKSLPAYVVLQDRQTAIRWAVKGARPEDLVLIAGKGHETYQIIGTQRVPFDDREVVLRVLEEMAG